MFLNWHLSCISWVIFKGRWLLTQALEVSFPTQFLCFDEMILYKNLSTKTGLPKAITNTSSPKKPKKTLYVYSYMYAAFFFCLQSGTKSTFTQIWGLKRRKKSSRSQAHYLKNICFVWEVLWIIKAFFCLHEKRWGFFYIIYHSFVQPFA